MKSIPPGLKVPINTMSGICIHFYEQTGSSLRWTHALCQHLTLPGDRPNTLLATSWDDSKVPTLSLTKEEALQLVSASPNPFDRTCP